MPSAGRLARLCVPTPHADYLRARLRPTRNGGSTLAMTEFRVHEEYDSVVENELWPVAEVLDVRPEPRSTEGPQGIAEGAGGAGRILVVCTANRGRSPMLAALLREALAELAPGVEIESAGLSAYELGRVGLGADPPIVELAARHGLDLSGHRVRPLSRELCEAADLVIVMEPWQREVLCTAFSEEADKLVTLNELAGWDAAGRIADTARLPREALEETLGRMRTMIERSLVEILRRLDHAPAPSA